MNNNAIRTLAACALKTIAVIQRLHQPVITASTTAAIVGDV